MEETDEPETDLVFSSGSCQLVVIRREFPEFRELFDIIESREEREAAGRTRSQRRASESVSRA